MRNTVSLSHRFSQLAVVALVGALGGALRWAQGPEPVTKVLVGAQGIACNETLSAGADVDASYAAVADGVSWTICLNSGNYNDAAVAFANSTRTGGYVTIRSVSGRSATLSRPTVHNADYLRFQSLTLTNMRVGHETLTSCPHHVEILDSTFVPDAPGLMFVELTACPTQNNLVDSSTFSNVDTIYADGRLALRGPINGVTIRNSFFGNNGYGDGIQISAIGSGIATIGPGNVFDGVSQAFCDANGGAHCDAIQCNPRSCMGGVTIARNYFVNGETYIMAPDGSRDLVIENNVFDECAKGYRGPVQVGQNSGPQDGAIFRHNTILCGNAGFAGSNALVENNIFGSGAEIDMAGGGGCDGTCSRRYNLFTSSANQSGTNAVIGAPGWVGGTWPSIPTTWAGWQLHAGSRGKNAGSDGQDLGTTYYGP